MGFIYSTTRDMSTIQLLECPYVGKDTSGTINRILNNIKQLLQIDLTFKEMFREQRGDIGKLKVMGLMVALRDTGLMHVYIPHERWLRKMNI